MSDVFTINEFSLLLLDKDLFPFLNITCKSKVYKCTYSSKQEAAVSTHPLSIKDPPQVFRKPLLPTAILRWTTHGFWLSSATSLEGETENTN